MVTPIPLSGLSEALGVGARSHIALTGGGGKSTLLHALADQLVGRVVLTTTTKMGSDQHRGHPVLVDPTDDQVGAAAAIGPVMVWSRVDGSKAIGVDRARCDTWSRCVEHVVVEADGSRRQPFKAPSEFEPVVPSTATLVVSVIGADALGRVIADQCHRPLRVAALAGCRADRRLDPVSAARVLLHERGVRRSVPPDADFTIVITKVDDVSRPLVDQLTVELRRRESEVRVVAIARQAPVSIPIRTPEQSNSRS